MSALGAVMKLCPFTHPIKRGSHVEPVDDYFHVVCRDCGAQGPERNTWAEAFKAWNDRRTRDDGKH
ncbi:hypothetical protein FKO01_04940 [Mesorhizobium sp. B2-3-3]|nr:hypothetical protein FKO01_04940 [Mesorhizobium sp. B2-3-3]